VVDWTEHDSLARDTERFQRLLQLQLPEGLEIEACELLSLRLVEDLSGEDADGLLVSYRMSFHDPTTGARGVQLYAGHIVTNARELFGAHAGRALAPVVFGPPLMFLPELDMVLFAFPNDARLLLLGDCISRAALEAFVAHANDFAGCSVVGSSYEVLGYDPDRACTLRFTTVFERDGEQRTHRLVAKTRIDGVLEMADSLKRLWESLPLRSGNWTLPRPYYFDPDRKLFWQSALDGQPFWSCYPNLDVAMIFEQMAAAAADIHHSGAAPKRKDVENLLAGGADRLIEADPKLGERQAELLKWLAESQSSLKSTEASLHGDFRPDHFLVDGPRVSLTRFDRPYLGDPARDLGRFASCVYATAVRGGIDPEVFREPLAAFYAEYARCAAEWHGMRAVCWYIAAELTGRHVPECLPLTGDAQARIERLLSLAEAHVKRMDLEDIQNAAAQGTPDVSKTPTTAKDSAAPKAP